MGIFKAYDIRGIYGKDVDEGIFYRIARAYAQFLRPAKVAVARDCRKSSPSLFAAFAKGLVDEGVDVIDLGLASTPMSYFANGSLGVDGSVMITASHNTREWNGCKLCRANAVPISGATGIKDIEALFNEINEFDPPAGVGEITQVDVSKAYAQHEKTVIEEEKQKRHEYAGLLFEPLERGRDGDNENAQHYAGDREDETLVALNNELTSHARIGLLQCRLILFVVQTFPGIFFGFDRPHFHTLEQRI